VLGLLLGPENLETGISTRLAVLTKVFGEDALIGQAAIGNQQQLPAAAQGLG